MLINELRKWLSCGGDQIAFFENFSPPKAFYYDLPKLRNFQESPTPPPPPFKYHPLILRNFLVKLSGPK